MESLRGGSLTLETYSVTWENPHIPVAHPKKRVGFFFFLPFFLSYLILSSAFLSFSLSVFLPFFLPFSHSFPPDR